MPGTSNERHKTISPKLPLLTGTNAEQKRQEILDYFLKSYATHENLYDVLISDEIFYKKAIPLRHPLIFYFGHTAAFFINKLRVSKFISKRLNASIESMVAIGVDEMSWDDLDEENYNWPTVDQVKAYRNEVKNLVCDFISTCEISLPIKADDPMWIILMGIEHELIHLETSSVLIRQLPIKDVRPDPRWSICPKSGRAPQNTLLTVKGQEFNRNKSESDPVWGWDNEYGSHSASVSDFKASKYLVSNEEYLAFVKDGGYSHKSNWSEEGWAWVQFSRASCPEFWVKTAKDYQYRTMLEIIEMPMDWPVDVNYLEAIAFCNWLSKKQGIELRLPTEDEWYVLRDKLNTDLPYWEKAPGNINLEHWCSACPVSEFEQAGGFFDIIGNVWQWTETPIYAFDGFKVHPAYDDFSVPTFDGKHNLFKGGSFISSGNCAIKDSRYAFRRHFFQHAGFRYIESAAPVIDPTNVYETDASISQYIDFHFGENPHSVSNFAQKCAEICIELMQDKTTERALDLGCAVGRSSFELARVFDYVDGLDFSTRFIQVAAKLQISDLQRYVIPEEGELVSYKEITLSQFGLKETASKVNFVQSDACNLAAKFNDYDLIFAGNLIDRLYAPKRFLETIHKRIRLGGLLVLTSPYTWLEEFTPREEWIGGFKKDGENFSTLDALHEILGEYFEAVEEPRDVPFVIRETARKFQHTVAQMTVWKRKS
jgi:5-histidylcysteine sulfoxide synthase/putative 4-mercaptohistidine N1-methyltranferase